MFNFAVLLGAEGFALLMRKIFTDANIYGQKWYRKLSPKHKCLWEYLCRQCDRSGVIEFDEEVATFLIGESIKDDDLATFGERLEEIKPGKYWIKGYCEFQYGYLSEQCSPHKTVIQLLHKHNLFERVTQGLKKRKDYKRKEKTTTSEESEAFRADSPGIEWES